MKKLILQSGENVKVSDTETKISFSAKNYGQTCEFNDDDQLIFKIKNSTGFLKEIEGKQETHSNLIYFMSEALNNLPADTYELELWISNNKGISIYPEDGFVSLNVTENATGVDGEVINTITIEDFEKRFVAAKDKLEKNIDDYLSQNPIEGPQGPKGDKGDPGETGPTGVKGDRGDPGETGPTGVKGDKGDPGEPGVAGSDGQDGYDAVDVLPNLLSSSYANGGQISGAWGVTAEKYAGAVPGETYTCTVRVNKLSTSRPTVTITAVGPDGSELGKSTSNAEFVGRKGEVTSTLTIPEGIATLDVWVGLQDKDNTLVFDKVILVKNISDGGYISLVKRIENLENKIGE